jgi:catechol 2,3-dioxygenase-like lactoylglutathione lyase family enzyme
MIFGAHVIIYTKDADADRAFIRDVLGFSHVDAGGGWLIFGLPPAELAMHPTDGAGSHELYLMCDDVEKFRAEMAGHGVPTGALQEQRWGVITDVALPSGAKLSVYEPRHPRPEPKTATKSRGKRAQGKPAAKGRAAKAESTATAKPVAKAKPAARAKPATPKPTTRKPASTRTGKSRR